MDNGLKIKSFYQDAYDESGRMARNPLEFIRCKEIITRYLSKPSMEIADIGGAAGVFSYWLASQGHHVHLLDFTPAHIAQAKEYGEKHHVALASYHCGDARHLPYDSNCFDVVLEMGPLYHLQDKDDRLQCISETKRVLKPGGVLLCEVISRYASLVDGFKYLNINDEKFIKILDGALETGMHSPGETPYFTSAFFHSPGDIKNEMAALGFCNVDIIAVEGFANALDSDKILKNEQQANLLLEYIRKTERVPELMGVSGHFFAIARK